MNKFFLYPLLLSLTLLFSCGSDSENLPDKFLVSLSVDDSYFQSGEIPYYIIKGMDGETLTFGRIENGDQIEINLPYQNDKIALTIVAISNALERVELESYVDIPIGKTLTLSNNVTEKDTDAGIRWINGDTSLDEIFISSSNIIRTFDYEEEFNLQFASNSPFTTITTFKEGEIPKYQSIELSSDVVSEVDMNQSETMSGNQAVSTFDNSNFHYTSVAGINRDVDDYFLYFSFEIADSNGDIDLFYPESDFENFEVHIDVNQNNDTKFFQNTRGTLPSEFKQLNTTFNISSNNLESAEIAVTGSVSYLRSSWATGRVSDISWRVYSGPELNNDYNLIDIPEQILAETEIFDQLSDVQLLVLTAYDIGGESFDNVVSDLTLNRIFKRPEVVGKLVWY